VSPYLDSLTVWVWHGVSNIERRRVDSLGIRYSHSSLDIRPDRLS